MPQHLRVPGGGRLEVGGVVADSGESPGAWGELLSCVRCDRSTGAVVVSVMDQFSNAEVLTL